MKNRAAAAGLALSIAIAGCSKCDNMLPDNAGSFHRTDMVRGNVSSAVQTVLCSPVNLTTEEIKEWEKLLEERDKKLALLKVQKENEIDEINAAQGHELDALKQQRGPLGDSFQAQKSRIETKYLAAMDFIEQKYFFQRHEVQRTYFNHPVVKKAIASCNGNQ